MSFALEAASQRSGESYPAALITGSARQVTGQRAIAPHWLSAGRAGVMRYANGGR
jgi:hypothetical protein